MHLYATLLSFCAEEGGEGAEGDVGKLLVEEFLFDQTAFIIDVVSFSIVILRVDIFITSIGCKFAYARNSDGEGKHDQ